MTAERSATTPERSSMPEPAALAGDLAERCESLEDPTVQGDGLRRVDYVLLVVATLLVPLAMIIVGNVL